MTRRSRRLAVSLLVLCAAFLATARWVLVPYRVRGDSMAPTLVGAETGGGDIVLVNRCAYISAGPSRWDVAILKHDGGSESVKRVAGLPGETVEIRDGKLLVNGARVAPPAQLAGEYIVQKGSFGHTPVRLAPDEYFFLGDSSYLSSDSRRWGPVKREDIEGRVIAVLLPWRRLRWLP
jgi:signal peptidase I